MMRRLLPFVVPLLFAFTLSQYAQTQRVRWDTWHQGATYSTPVTEDQNFSNCFVNNGYSLVGGLGVFRGDGFSCSWAVDGVGAGNMVMDIVHEDGGVDCQCTVGACVDGPNIELPCSCGATFHTLEGSTYCIKVDTTSSCGTTEPAQWHCSMDLFR
jgi:hypothetical protein